MKQSASGNFDLAVNALKEKAHRALYAIKRNFHEIQIPIKIWGKIFDSVIIRLYGCEIWGPLSRLDYIRWVNHPIESLHAEFLKTMQKVQR